jgi:hypothetical protein
MKAYKQPQHTPDKSTDQQLIIEFFHRIIMHHAFWFVESQKKLGNEKALELLSEVFKTSFRLQMKRLGKKLGFEINEKGIPSFLDTLPDETLAGLRNDLAVNWLANDGIWFQAIEQQEGMNTAKHCNDEAWRQLSPTEAHMIKKMLHLPEKAGIKGLMKALKYRLYWFINEQSFRDITENSFVFTNDNCRVQSARERKDLEHYPCKSAGYIEYSTFASTIDPRIKTSIVFCPPDTDDRAFYCGWKFTLENNNQ